MYAQHGMSAWPLSRDGTIADGEIVKGSHGDLHDEDMHVLPRVQLGSPFARPVTLIRWSVRGARMWICIASAYRPAQIAAARYGVHE